MTTYTRPVAVCLDDQKEEREFSGDWSKYGYFESSFD